MVSSQESPVVVWTPEMDVNLFYALIDHKPVGVNKHFHMIFIYERFNQTTETKLSVDQLWQRLSTLYDLKELNDNETLPFPHEETEFSLDSDNNSKVNVSGDSESSNKLSTSSISESATISNKPKTSQATPSRNTAANQSSTKSSLKKK